MADDRDIVTKLTAIMEKHCPQRAWFIDSWTRQSETDAWTGQREVTRVPPPPRTENMQ